MAPAFWAEVARHAEHDPGYARLGRLQPLADDAALALARDRAAGAARLWPAGVTWRVVAASEARAQPTGHDWLPPSPTGWLVEDTLTARIAPRRAIAALAAALRAGGADIRHDGAAEGMVVEATGHAGLRARLGPQAPATAGGEKGQAALIALDRRDAPQIFADGVHIVPQADGTVAIGSTSERDWTGLDTDQALDSLISRARALAPLGDAPVVARWAGIRPRWTTRSPLIGADPARPGRFIANGGYKIGFAVAPLAGRMLAALMLGCEDTIPAAFRP
jgi:glycine/D-amino acid oxidase-like deaminating enzyme